MSSHFAPMSPSEHARANAEYDVPDRCRYCGYPFMDHNNGKCPDLDAEEAAQNEAS